MKNRNFTQKSRILRDTPTGKPAAWSNTDIEFPMKFNILWDSDLETSKARKYAIFVSEGRHFQHASGDVFDCKMLESSGISDCKPERLKELLEDVSSLWQTSLV